MPINAPIRKGLKAKRIAENYPNLSPGEVAKLAGTNRGVVAVALKKDHFGRDKPKSRAT